MSYKKDTKTLLHLAGTCSPPKVMPTTKQMGSRKTSELAKLMVKYWAICFLLLKVDMMTSCWEKKKEIHLAIRSDES